MMRRKLNILHSVTLWRWVYFFFILHGEIIFLLYLLEQYETKRVLNDIRNVIRKCKSTDVEVLMFERTSKVRESIIITFFFL